MPATIPAHLLNGKGYASWQRRLRNGEPNRQAFDRVYDDPSNRTTTNEEN